MSHDTSHSKNHTKDEEEKIHVEADIKEKDGKVVEEDVKVTSEDSTSGVDSEEDEIPFDAAEEDTIQSDSNEVKVTPESPAVILQDYNESEIEEIFRRRLEELGGGSDADALERGQAVFINNVRDTKSIDYAIQLAQTNYSQDVERRLKHLEEIKAEEVKDEDFTYRLKEDPSSPSTLGSAKISVPAKKGMVRGVDAAMLFNTLSRGGMRNVMLYNSGISVDIRRPTLDEIQELLSNCQEDFDKFGGTLGAQYYLFEDFLIKRHFINFIFKLIVRSSLADWNNGDAAILMQAIKLNDYQALLTEVAQLMHPDGFKGFNHVCPKCKHRQTLTLAVMKLIHVRYKKMPKGYIDWMARTRQAGKIEDPLDQVVAQQRTLGFDQDITAGRYRFHMSPPSLYAYVEAGQSIHAAIVTETQNDDSPERRFSAVSTKIMRFYLPWVEKMSAIPEEGETADEYVTTDDKFVISGILDDLLSDREITRSFEKKMTAMINDSNLTFIGYKTPKCPKCGDENEAGHGFSGVDAQSAFFILAMAKLQDAS